VHDEIAHRDVVGVVIDAAGRSRRDLESLQNVVIALNFDGVRSA
jgi:hypothetical protein